MCLHNIEEIRCDHGHREQAQVHDQEPQCPRSPSVDGVSRAAESGLAAGPTPAQSIGRRQVVRMLG